MSLSSHAVVKKTLLSWSITEKLDQVSEAAARRNRGLRHGEEVHPVLIEAARILPRVDDEAPEAPPARMVPQGQLGLPLRHVEADVHDLDHQQVKESACDHAAVPGAGEAEGHAAEIKNVTLQYYII